MIGVLTGEILDYDVLSLFCKECSVHEKSEKDSEQFLQWKEKHKQHCSINFEGSSGAMEAAGAARIFCRSIQKRKLKYTTFVGDGDSSTFQIVSEKVKEMFGERYRIKKEDCL